MNQLKEQAALALVALEVLPDSYKKVLQAKKLLAKGKAKNSSEACKLAQISRSVYYKYKDFVWAYDDKSKEKLVTIYMRLSDEPGVLSSVLTAISDFGGNIITVNQNIPAEMVATVTISFRLKDKKTALPLIFERLQALYGVVEIKRI